MILQRAADDLRRARAVAVHQRDHRHVRVLARLCREIILIGVGHAAARVDDHVSAWKESIGDANGLVQRSAGVLPEIEDQPLHAVAAQFLQRVAQFAIRGFRELIELHVPRFLVDHERRLNGRDVHFITHDIHVDQAVVTAALDADIDQRPFWPFELLDCLIRRPPLHIEVAHLGQDVAAAESLLIGGRPLEERHHGDVAVDGLDGDPETVITSLLPLAHLRVRLGVEKARMRIERVQHPVDGAVDHAIGRHVVHIFLLDGVNSGREYTVLLANFVLSRKRAAAKHTAGSGRQRDRKNCHRKETRNTHIH